MSYGRTAKFFHWLTVILVLVMIPVGMMMIQDYDRSIAAERLMQDRLFILHKGLGPVLLVVIVARLLWRLTHRPPPLPDSIPRLQQLAAEATHWGLYALLLIQAVSGYIRTVADGFPIEWMDSLGIPTLLARNPELAKKALFIHEYAVLGLMALIAAHVGAALMHTVIKKDGVMQRMWPPY